MVHSHQFDATNQFCEKNVFVSLNPFYLKESNMFTDGTALYIKLATLLLEFNERLIYNIIGTVHTRSELVEIKYRQEKMVDIIVRRYLEMIIVKHFIS